MTKEDYMRLPKERLAELLVERDRQLPISIPPFERIITPCYAPDGICTNPHRDCINCPRQFGTSEVITTTKT